MAARIAVLAAWATVPLPRPLYRCNRHPPLQLNFLDDFKAEGGYSCDSPGSQMLHPDVQQFVGEVNQGRQDELRQVARVKGTSDGVDWGREELVSIEVTGVDDRGILLRALLCSAADQRCITVDMPIEWPPTMPNTGMQAMRLPEMRSAFAELSRRAYAAALDRVDAVPPEYQAQQATLSGLMSLMNRDFGKLLRFYALKHAREALSPTEQVVDAKMTQLFHEGLSLELTTLDVGRYSLEFGEQLTRATWSTSILFPNRCQSPDEVEHMLVTMFDRTAAAVEEGRINVEGVAPERESETIANMQREQEGDDRTEAFRARDRRLRRAVRIRRMASSNEATARYIAYNRQWNYDDDY